MHGPLNVELINYEAVLLKIMIFVSALVIPHANRMFSTPIYSGTCNLSVFTIFSHFI
jgi:hypothetical protein